MGHYIHSQEPRVYTETFNIREESRILKMIDEIAKRDGTDRSAIIRTAIRRYLTNELKLQIPNRASLSDVVEEARGMKH